MAEEDIKEVRMLRFKLQIEKLELERNIELAYASGDPTLKPFIIEAEKMIVKVQEVLSRKNK